jgi:hypothetical protein
VLPSRVAVMLATVFGFRARGMIISARQPNAPVSGKDPVAWEKGLRDTTAGPLTVSCGFLPPEEIWTG